MDTIYIIEDDEYGAYYTVYSDNSLALFDNEGFVTNFLKN